MQWNSISGSSSSFCMKWQRQCRREVKLSIDFRKGPGWWAERASRAACQASRVEIVRYARCGESREQAS